MPRGRRRHETSALPSAKWRSLPPSWPGSVIRRLRAGSRSAKTRRNITSPTSSTRLGLPAAWSWRYLRSTIASLNSRIKFVTAGVESPAGSSLHHRNCGFSPARQLRQNSVCIFKHVFRTKAVPGLVYPLVRIVRAFSRGPQFAPPLPELGGEARVKDEKENPRLPAVYTGLKRRTTRIRRGTLIVELL